MSEDIDIIDQPLFRKLYEISFKEGLLTAATLIERGVPRPGIMKKQDQCAHNKFAWEDCESCCVDEIRRVAELVEEVSHDD